MKQPHAYCTYFDSGYLSRGLALIESLRSHGDDSPVWVLALDDRTKEYLDEAQLPGVLTLSIADIEAAEPELPALRASRSRMEYIFTSTPLLMRWVANKQSDPSAVVIYVDSDLFFFDNPFIVLDAMDSGSIGIIEHKYAPRLASRLAKYGRFNVGWVGIRCDQAGRACLDWWASSTIEWCLDRPEDGKYADQGYLDQFPDRFAGVVVLESQGLNLAPWNTGGHSLALANDRVLIDGADSLLFFHFHGVRRVGDWYVSSQLIYGSRLGPVLRSKVYLPYLRELERQDRIVYAKLGVPPTNKRGNGLRGVVSRLRKSTIDRLAIVTGNAVSLRTIAARR
jgi:hypothetical protein